MILSFIFKILYPYLFIISHPSYWTNVETINPQFDSILKKLLDEGTMFTQIGSYRAQFGPFELWIENHPYASFKMADGGSVAPARFTRKLLMDRLVESQVKNRFKI